MDLFTQLFAAACLPSSTTASTRIVIYGYLSGLSRPERVVNFFHQVVGVPVVSREILSQRTADYQNWLEAFCTQSSLPDRMGRKGRAQGRPCPAVAVVAWCGRIATASHYILKSMEQGPKSSCHRCQSHPTKDVNYRILARQAQPLHPLLFLHPRRNPRPRW